MLREAEVEPSPGRSVGAVCRKLGVTSHASYRWHKEFGGVAVDRARRIPELSRRCVA